MREGKIFYNNDGRQIGKSVSGVEQTFTFTLDGSGDATIPLTASQYVIYTLDSDLTLMYAQHFRHNYDATGTKIYFPFKTIESISCKGKRGKFKAIYNQYVPFEIMDNANEYSLFFKDNYMYIWFVRGSCFGESMTITYTR